MTCHGVLAQTRLNICIELSVHPNRERGCPRARLFLFVTSMPHLSSLHAVFPRAPWEGFPLQSCVSPILLSMTYFACTCEHRLVSQQSWLSGESCVQGQHHTGPQGGAPAYDWPPHSCRHLLHLLQYCAWLEICELLHQPSALASHEHSGKVLNHLLDAGASF